MSFNLRRLIFVFIISALIGISHAATFGTVVPVRGTPSDIALDESRGKLYIANLAGGRIEVMDTATRTLGAVMPVPLPPSAVALSPDNRYLVVGEYYNFGNSTAKGGFTIFDLAAGTQQDAELADPVLAMAFGAGVQAFVVTTTGVSLLDPVTGLITPVTPIPGKSDDLPVPFATFPPNITQASVGVSGDGLTIFALMSSTDGKYPDMTIRYQVGSSVAEVGLSLSTPLQGPRAVSVNQDGSRALIGWILGDQGHHVAQFPYPLGDFRRGGHAFDFVRNVIYADAPVTASESPVLHVMDTDNLTVRERIQLPQMMAGRSVFSGDMNTLYAISDSGVMILPVDSLASAHRLATLQEDAVFLADACNRGVISQTINIVDLGGGSVDFTLSLPANTPGIQLSQTSGTTPATIRVDVDPTFYQNARGTTMIPLSLSSSGAINLPFPVRLLINTRDVNQRGRIVNVPGKIVDILADPVRNRIYMIRQDKNLVLVYDSASFQQIATMRTGNTPVHMAITEDQRYLIAGNANSQIASVFDLETLLPVDPILFGGAFPYSIAVGHGAIWATVRASFPNLVRQGLHRIDFADRRATAPATLGIYCNGGPLEGEKTDCPYQIPPTTAVAVSPSLNYILLAAPGGVVAQWDASNDLWVVSRNDLKSTGGSYGVFGDNLFLVDNNLIDQSLFPIGALESSTGLSSGMGLIGTGGLRSTATSANGQGTLERVDLGTLQAFNATQTSEAPHTAASLLTTPIGQIGELILPFTRTMAVPADQSSIVLLTQSGLTVVPTNFDAGTTPPTVSGINNVADGGADVAPGGLVVISGSGMASQSAAAGGLPLPTTLGDVCVTVSNVALPLFSVSSTLLTAQLPFTVVGGAPLVLRNSGGISNTLTVNIQQFAPAIFYNSQVPTVVRLKNNQIVNFTNPVHPEEDIAIYLTGMGQTSPEAPLGDAAPSPPALVTTPPTVTLGNTPLGVTFAGLVPGEVGVYQVNAHIPQGISEASQAPLVIRQGAASKSVLVRVVNP